MSKEAMAAALDFILVVADGGYPFQEREEIQAQVVSALEKALAQPEQEPVAWRVHWPTPGGANKWLLAGGPISGFVSEPLYSKPDREETIKKQAESIEPLPSGNVQAPYGYCPICACKGILRERRLNGNDKCAMAHEYPSSQAKPAPIPTERNFCQRCGKRASKDPDHIHTCSLPGPAKSVEEVAREMYTAIPTEFELDWDALSRDQQRGWIKWFEAAKVALKC